jgi:hypothetical protein
MIDSGAFSAWNSGVFIDLKQYIGFLKQHGHLLFSYASLDVLPAGKESARTRAETERCAALSDANQQRMKDAGLSPIPIFHQGESFKWLELMLKNGEPYIGVATRKDLPMKMTLPWLDQVWAMLRDRAGKPLVKTHGFGITASRLLWRFPWFTVDSSTWSLQAGFGKIFVPPRGNDGAPNYRSDPFTVTISGIEGRRAAGRHFDILEPGAQEWVRTFVASAGLTMSDVRNVDEGRRLAMLFYFQQLTNAIRVSQPGTSFLVMFASSYRNNHNQTLNAAKANTRLLSYYEIRDKDPAMLLRYIESGVHTDGRIVKRKADWSKRYYLNHRRKALSARQLRYDIETAEIET